MRENISEFLIDKNASVKEAMRKLDLSSRKVLFVTDENGKLFGALTDGDIRRWILKEGSLESSIDKVCNRRPHTLDPNYHTAEVKKMMVKENIESLPVVDESGGIRGLLFWEEVFAEAMPVRPGRSLDVPVVIMAGGKGTRMEPFTKVLPKPLIPIGERTILECIIDEFRQYDVREFFLTLNYKGEMIEAYFKNIEKQYNVEYLWEKDFYGTAGSLAMMNGKVITDCIVTNCDNIVKTDYFEVLEFHRANNSYLTILSSIQHHKIPYGVVSFKEGGIVTKILEKPEYSFTINTGIYILNKKALSYIPTDELFHMTHLIGALINDNKKVMTYPVSENDYIDIGQWEEYRKAVNKFQT